MPPKARKAGTTPSSKPATKEASADANRNGEVKDEQEDDSTKVAHDNDESENAASADAPKSSKGNVATHKREEGGDGKSQNSSSKTNGKLSSKKRKAENAHEPSKASRRSVRGGTKTKPSPAQVVSFLLSGKALELCRPDDEAEDIKSRGKDIRTYGGAELSAFEELVCAVVLSRPISHRLGLRTIRTILNDPYSFISPKAIIDAKPDKAHQAMFDARTQHKDKTATQISMIAQVVKEKFASSETDTSLDKVRTEAGKDWDAERDLLQSSIKGLGKTGLDIFFRRVQWLWPEAYPFVDERTARGVEKLGLPKTADELASLISEHWAELDTSGLPKGNKDQAKRRAFVIVCERATSADLEGKAEALLDAAAAATSS
ncbi:hypothetical protein ANO11243_079310 [Dothideomycetidae sp. 11243]|nr:hypothetical protein ANO11243_079310 [fungal sp. No.11243]